MFADVLIAQFRRARMSYSITERSVGKNFNELLYGCYMFICLPYVFIALFSGPQEGLAAAVVCLHNMLNARNISSKLPPFKQ